MKLRYKILLCCLTLSSLTWCVCGAVIASNFDEHTMVPIGWVATFLGATLSIVFFTGWYVKGAKDELKAINKALEDHTKTLTAVTDGMAMASGLAAEAGRKAVAAVDNAGLAVTEAKAARAHVEESIGNLACQQKPVRKCAVKKPKRADI